MIQVFPDVLQFRGRLVSNYALLDEDRVVLIDGGFLTNSPDKLERQLHEVGRSLRDVSHILLTHGHFDHVRNISELKRRSGAPVFAPALDREIISGKYRYSGFSRICGWMEALGRRMLGYKIPEVDRWLEPGESLDVWGGMECIALPGHTPGHSGFYSPSRELLFAADLFSNYLGFPKYPPPWFNVDSESVKDSVQRANRLALRGGVLLNHCHSGTPSDHRSDLTFLAESMPERKKMLRIP